ncbi:MAG: ATP12 family protein [Rhizomicrobium sp.]
MKRFYKAVSVAPGDGGFAVHLDGKPLKTPARAPFALPNVALAEAIAEEWREQGEEIDMASMPMTRLAFAAVDSVPQQRAAMIEHLLGFGRSDLLSYRAEFPDALIARQAASWDPLLAWLAQTHGARLAITAGIQHVGQSDEAMAALQRALTSLGDYELAALHAATTITGSLTIALALIAGRITADEAFHAAHVDEHFQAEKWGRDEPAEARRAGLRAELQSVERFLKAIRCN